MFTGRRTHLLMSIAKRQANAVTMPATAASTSHIAEGSSPSSLAPLPQFASSWPDGQCTWPSHQRLAAMQAPSSGHLCGQSRLLRLPFSISRSGRSRSWLRRAARLLEISNQEAAAWPGSRDTKSRRSAGERAGPG